MSSDITDTFLEKLTKSFDGREYAITMITRTVDHLKNSAFLQTALSMAIPLIYAHWEGYVREVFQGYVEYIEECKCSQADLNPHVLAYSWSKHFQRLQGKGSAEDRAEFARVIRQSLNGKVAFNDPERSINTQSNLNFKVIAELCTCLCLDVEVLRDREKELNVLVHQRNSIAHGGRHDKISMDEVVRGAKLVLDLMVRVEGIIRDAVDKKSFLLHSPGFLQAGQATMGGINA